MTTLQLINCKSITGEIPHFVRDDDVAAVDLDEAGAFGNKMPNAPASSPTTQNHHVIPNGVKRNEESPEILQRIRQVVINAGCTKDLYLNSG